MGQIAQQARGQQLQPLNPRGKLKQLVEHSWPQTRACPSAATRQRGIAADVHQQHQPHPRIGGMHAGQRPFLLHAVRRPGLAPVRRDGLGQAYILPYGNKNYATGEKQATFVIGYKGMLKLLENSGIYAQPRAVYEDDNIKLKLDENGVPTIECPDEVNVDADHSEDKLKFVYLSVQLPNGGRYADYMSKRDLLEYREKRPSAEEMPEMDGYTFDRFIVGPSNKFAHAAASPCRRTPARCITR